MTSTFTILSLALTLSVGAATLGATTNDVQKPAGGSTTDDGKGEKKKEEPKREEAAKLAIGKAAPVFTLNDIDGKSVKLADFKGKVVVLEWFNPECPFVVSAHTDGPLKDMAARAQKDGVVWLSINSSAQGKEGSSLEKNKKTHDEWKMASNVLLDPKGEVGRMYEAKTTPQCFVIDAKGVLVYRGALDNAPMGKVDGEKRIDYLANALADVKAGKPVATAETKSWGCSVKYDSK